MFSVFKYTDQLQTYPTEPFYKEIKRLLVEIFLVWSIIPVTFIDYEFYLTISQNRKGQGHFYLTFINISLLYLK